MRLPAITRKKARIEIIPMIDTMFFLLVFFMIATLSMTLQHGMPINLPKANSSTLGVPDHISLTITKKGDLFFNKSPISSIFELEKRLNNFLLNEKTISVVINADTDVSHGQVIEVMDSVRKAGITNMAIATKPKSK